VQAGCSDGHPRSRRSSLDATCSSLSRRSRSANSLSAMPRS
jgi:hypothetical protein